MTSEPVRLSRADLYEEVWREPMVKVAARYGLSDVGLAKICRKLHVPVPYRGYWRKKELGHPAQRTPLPKLSPSAAAEVGVDVVECLDHPAGLVGYGIPVGRDIAAAQQEILADCVIKIVTARTEVDLDELGDRIRIEIEKRRVCLPMEIVGLQKIQTQDHRNVRSIDDAAQNSHVR